MEGTRRSLGWPGIALGVVLAAGTCVIAGAATHAESEDNELVIFDFEGDLQDWSIPDWAMTSADYTGKGLNPSLDFTSHGKGSLQVTVAFPGKKWSGAYLENMMYVTDWTPFDAIAMDVYVPYNAPKGLLARFILTVGEEWKWTEMNRAMPLKPDNWTTITAKIKPGSLDWKFFPDEAFRKDVRKVGIRIESNGPAYSGPVYIDNVRLVKRAP